MKSPKPWERPGPGERATTTTMSVWEPCRSRRSCLTPRFPKPVLTGLSPRHGSDCDEYRRKPPVPLSDAHGLSSQWALREEFRQTLRLLPSLRAPAPPVLLVLLQRCFLLPLSSYP